MNNYRLCNLRFAYFNYYLFKEIHNTVYLINPIFYLAMQLPTTVKGGSWIAFLGTHLLQVNINKISGIVFIISFWCSLIICWRWSSKHFLLHNDVFIRHGSPGMYLTKGKTVATNRRFPLLTFWFILFNKDRKISSLWS